MRITSTFALALLGPPIFFACTASPGEAPTSTEAGLLDASTDESRSLEAGSRADAADAAAPDAAAPRPLDIVCEGDPCYVAISGDDGFHYCALLRDKTVRCWGRDTKVAADGDAALGRGAPVTALEGATAAPVVGLPGPVDGVRVGSNLGACARTVDGRLYCWGRNDHGQLGSSPTRPRLLVPTPIEELPPVDDFALGFTRGCAITTADRALYCWGGGTTGVFEPPHAMTGFTPPVRALAMGSLKGNAAWGEETHDMIVTLLEGDILAATGATLPTGNSDYPTDPMLRSGIRRIAPFALATGDGVFRRWIPAEERLYFPPSTPIAELRVSGDYAANDDLFSQRGSALTSTGRLFRWGRNMHGELGMDPRTLVRAGYPVEVLQVRGKVAAFATTVGSTCALLVSGKIQCWGNNEFGELGRGTIDLEIHAEPEPIREAP